MNHGPPTIRTSMRAWTRRLASASTMSGRRGVSPVSVSRAAPGSIAHGRPTRPGQVEAVHQLLGDEPGGHDHGIFLAEQRLDRAAVAGGGHL